MRLGFGGCADRDRRLGSRAHGPAGARGLQALDQLHRAHQRAQTQPRDTVLFRERTHSHHLRRQRPPGILPAIGHRQERLVDDQGRPLAGQRLGQRRHLLDGQCAAGRVLRVAQVDRGGFTGVGGVGHRGDVHPEAVVLPGAQARQTPATGPDRSRRLGERRLHGQQRPPARAQQLHQREQQLRRAVAQRHPLGRARPRLRPAPAAPDRPAAPGSDPGEPREWRRPGPEAARTG